MADTKWLDEAPEIDESAWLDEASTEPTPEPDISGMTLEERKKMGISNMPLPFRAVAKIGQEASKAIEHPREYIMEGIDPETGEPNVVQRALRGGVQGATLGFSDEIAGALESASGKTSYEQARDAIRAKNEAAQAASGGEYGAASLAGALLPIAATGGVGAAGTSPGALANIGRGAAVGAGYGGAIGAGHAEEDTPIEALKGAAIGGTLGAGLGGVASLAQKVGMSVPALKAWLERQAGYQALKGLGATRVDVAKLETPARGGVPGTAAKIGQEALKEGVPLSDPQAARAALRAASLEEGARMGAVKATPGAESAVDFPAFAATVERDVIQPLMSPATPQFRGTAVMVKDWLDDLTMGLLRRRAAAEGKALIPFADVGNKPAEMRALKAFQEFAGKGARPKLTVLSEDPAAALGKLSMDEAHEVRMGLDAFSKAHGVPNPGMPLAKQKLIDARNAMSEQLKAGAASIGKGAEWEGANEAFAITKQLEQLASRGTERQIGNDLVGLPEFVVGAKGGLAGIKDAALAKLWRTFGPEAMAKGGFGAAKRLPATVKSVQGPVSVAARYGPAETAMLIETGEQPGIDPVKALSEAAQGNQADLGKYRADVMSRLHEGGQEALGRWHYLQASKDPEYRSMMKRLTQTEVAQ